MERGLATHSPIVLLRGVSERPDPAEVLKALRERRLREAEAAIDRDMASLAEAVELAKKYPELFATALAATGLSQSESVTKPPLTVADLIDRYRADERSPFHLLRFRTRENYESLLKRLRRDHGDTRLSDLTGDEIKRLHGEWSAGGQKTAMAHSLVTMLRILASFGVDFLKAGDAERLSYVLHRMRFSMEKSQRGRINQDQVDAIIAEAHAQGLPSIALAQALQSDCGLRQRDVIGEWVPMEEPGMSDITWGEFGKWIRGLRWNEISDDFVLVHTASKNDEELEILLRGAPRVMAELRRQFCKPGETLTRAKLPASGAIIINEKHGKPYLLHTFRRIWRKVATAAGVPKNVYNMDSHEGTDGAEPEAQAGVR